MRHFLALQYCNTFKYNRVSSVSRFISSAAGAEIRNPLPMPKLKISRLNSNYPLLWCRELRLLRRYYKGGYVKPKLLINSALNPHDKNIFSVLSIVTFRKHKNSPCILRNIFVPLGCLISCLSHYVYCCAVLVCTW